MDRKQAKYILDNLEVLKAFVNGETIQYWHDASDCWRDTETPSFSPEFEYRVKPSVTITFRRYLWKDSQGNIKLGLWTPSIFSQDSVTVVPGFIKWIDNETQTDEFFL